jgi:hypothetical protein
MLREPVLLYNEAIFTPLSKEGLERIMSPGSWEYVQGSKLPTGLLGVNVISSIKKGRLTNGEASILKAGSIKQGVFL